ncbi:RbsD/FucU domain-containing protein [Microbacterium sp. NPDC057407]|uniref:RbsD/FucU domain-containing protein n=1 Tax=Microbacterium sp. NPDC057407 TaxID=3346120 RepID=UPI003670A37B
MLTGINPLLSGKLLLHLDRMGHSDAVVIADAHFPVYRLGLRQVELPNAHSPEVVAAIRSVLPLDAAPALDLMATPGGEELDIHLELTRAAGATDKRLIERYSFYASARDAYLIVRTGEIRQYGNAILRKGIVTPKA